MSKITRITVLAMSLMSLFAVTSSAAGAVTWTNTGQTAFTATAGTVSYSVTATALACSSADASGTTTTPASGIGAAIVSGTIKTTGCRVAIGDLPWHCTYTLTGSTFIAGVTNGNADLTCGIFLSGREACHIEGRTPANYTNGAGGSAGILALPHSSTLIITDGNGGGSCPVGSNERLTLAPVTFRVTSGTGPIFATD
jgi:hypothetical protein